MKRVVIIYQLDENKKVSILVTIHVDEFYTIFDEEDLLNSYAKKYDIERSSLIATRSVACIPDPRLSK